MNVWITQSAMAQADKTASLQDEGRECVNRLCWGDGRVALMLILVGYPFPGLILHAAYIVAGCSACCYEQVQSAEEEVSMNASRYKPCGSLVMYLSGRLIKGVLRLEIETTDSALRRACLNQCRDFLCLSASLPLSLEITRR